jgi:hypothetical protein
VLPRDEHYTASAHSFEKERKREKERAREIKREKQRKTDE